MMRNSKSQIPNPRQIQNPKLEIPNGVPDGRQRFGHLDLGAWGLFGIWNLGFGICGLLILVLLVCAGCETPPPAGAPAAQAPGESPRVAEQPPAPVPTGFGPAKVSVLPLSEIVGPAGAGRDAKMSVYVALLDAFGCSVKTPCTLRFELYEYVPRSARSAGQRLMIWPDIDLTHPAENHKYWRDFLRAYEFQFDVQADRGATYVLEATCLCPDGRRLSADQAIQRVQ